MNIIITGASKGIGYELTKLFSRNNDNQVIAIARSKELLKEIESKCPNNNVITINFDLENLTGIQSELCNKIKNHISSVDILINNAGFLLNKPFTDISIDEITKTFNINFIGPSVLTQQLLPLFKESSIKHIVNISSMGGFQGSAKFPGLSYYSASKAALANMTECLAEELKDSDIKVNCLALGAVNTKMLQEAFPGYEAPVNPSEMAQFIYDFAINAYKFLNGKIIPLSLSTP